MEVRTMENLESLARAYLSAVGNKELDKVERLLAPNVTFTGPVTKLSGAADFVAALRRIGAVHVRNDIQRVFVDGNEACVIYDFVTDTIGSVPTIEWLRFDGGRIRDVKLYYDQVPWQKLREELARRAAQAAQ
jgi:hypothetical protein